MVGNMFYFLFLALAVLARVSEFGFGNRVHAKGFRLLSKNTNKMQLCNRIYYSKVY
jgi:hypothetical protein